MTILLVLGVIVGSLPVLDFPMTMTTAGATLAEPPTPPQAEVTLARGDKRQARRGKADKKQRQKKAPAGKRRKGNRKPPPALDAKQIAAENQAAAAAISSCDGLETVRVAGADYCTHGEDPQSFGRAGSTAGSANAPQAEGIGTSRALCLDDGQSGPRVQLVYVHANNQPNRLANLLPTFRRLAAEMDTILDQSAQKTGGSLRIRFVTNAQCQVVVAAEPVQANRLAGFGPVINDLKARGYDAANRKYLLLVDTNVYCGVGTFQQSDSVSTTAHDLTGYARVDTPCWDAGTMLHELGHTLGAVQYSAPHTSRGAHCIDEWDVMCYSDTPYKPKMQIICDDGRQDFRLDCGNDDYFAANPAPGSYLTDHWNMARSIYFTNSDGQACVDAALEPDDAYWYAYWNVPMPRMKVGEAEQHAFCTEPGDTDWMLFTGEQGATYEVATRELGPNVDTQLVVYRGFSEQGWGGMDRIASNDNRAASDPSSQITFTAPASGSYLIGVSEANNRAGYDATYTISLQAAPATGSATLALSRVRLRSQGRFTATITGVASGATVQFHLERKGRTTPLGTATADDTGTATALLSIPKGASPGRNVVEGTASDGSAATTAVKVKQDGGRKHKGGHKKRTKPTKHRKRH